jgi:serine/threonine protein kinase
MSYDGDVKLLDFGIAQALMKFTSEIGVLKGKFSYMSPEQIRGMPLDARTDVFSAGIILHEMLTTEKLFRGDTEFALMEKVRKADVPPPSNFNRRVTAELDAISLKALARDVADRYQSAAQLAAALDALIAGYRFDPKELRQFMRQMFRKEYARELEDAQAALDAQPLVGGSITIPPITAGDSGTHNAVRTSDGFSTGNSSVTTGGTTNPQQSSPTTGSGVPVIIIDPAPPNANPSPSPSQTPTQPQADDRKGGFWGSLFKRKKPE